MERNLNMKEINPTINYTNESIDITKKCCKYLIENHYYENDKEKNTEILERFLINYSILKLYDWQINIEKLEIENWDYLPEILKTMSDYISTEEEKQSFFEQYVHCILYVDSNMNHKSPMQWKCDKNIDGAYCIKEDKFGNIQFITNEILPFYQIPIELLSYIKYQNMDQKNPILKK